MLEIKNITKSFRQRGMVLNELTLNVNEGDSVSIAGPSGSGKTTLLNIIGLLDKPDSGDVLFRGVRILDYDQDSSASYRNQNVGFVFQEHLLLPYLTVKENILLPLLASNLSGNEFDKRVEDAVEMMKKTGIADLAGKYPGQISGGEAQRATLVRALVNRPSILLADEPTGSLDRKNAENLGDLLVGMNNEYGITLIVATHSAELADKMKFRFNLSEGKLFPANGKHN
ncbi:MAG TPA: ABC transporter ATP-binding protein [Bacteroidales bacterium]|jgi:ABC-type lipoprotein export system ATPase subunit|nr:ABC transporter ATP-binding protein [Bacteroidales bacterium]